MYQNKKPGNLITTNRIFSKRIYLYIISFILAITCLLIYNFISHTPEQINLITEQPQVSIHKPQIIVTTSRDKVIQISYHSDTSTRAYLEYGYSPNNLVYQLDSSGYQDRYTFPIQPPPTVKQIFFQLTLMDKSGLTYTSEVKSIRIQWL